MHLVDTGNWSVKCASLWISLLRNSNPLDVSSDIVLMALWSIAACQCSPSFAGACQICQATFVEHDKEERHRIKNSKHRFFEHPAPRKEVRCLQVVCLDSSNALVNLNALRLLWRWDLQTFSTKGCRKRWKSLQSSVTAGGAFWECLL